MSVNQGHEFSGTIAELGDGVTDLKVGQKAAIFPVLTDHTCFYCKQELYGMCDSRGFMGYSGWGAGMQEYTCVEKEAIHVLPDDMPLDVGALVEPFAVSWHAVRLAQPKPGDVAFILGAGM